MSGNSTDQLAALIQHDRAAVLQAWKEQVRQLPSARHLDAPTLIDHIPRLLDELIAALQADSVAAIPEALRKGSPAAHGLQRLEDGFDIEEVVAEYNILRGCINDLAERNALALQSATFRIINRILDEAIGLAVQTYATQRALEVQHRREEYLAFVAHDLRTPLNAIALAARVLEMKFPEAGSAAETSRLMNALHRNVQYLSELVRKILDENDNLQTETGVKLQRRAFDLWPLVESLIHDLHPVAGTASTALHNAVPDDLIVHADASLLRRVLQNLIANAITYTPRGEVTIGARVLGGDGAVECWVHDNGAGIPADHLEKIFEKGESDPQNADSLGLGLAIVRTFTEAHGGRVTVESQEGTGSTFRILLPGKSGSLP